jgi:SAM-dependent methyltransferase
MMRTPYDIESEVEGFHWWFTGRRKLLKSLLYQLCLPSRSVALDIGCGTGSNLRALGSRGLKAIGLDRSIHALALARQKIKFSFINGDLDNLPIRPNSIGLIVAMDVLEHLEDDMKAIHELHQALQGGGILILTVPAFKFLWGIQDVVTGHKRRYSRQEIMEKLSHEGFEVLKSSYFNFFLFFPILFARRLIRLFGLRIRSENEINSRFINFLFKGIFSLEPPILEYFSFPFGVSFFCIAMKR